ncbi:Vacuolar amino acid transporter 1, partial [Tetrabaena socialis]
MLRSQLANGRPATRQQQRLQPFSRASCRTLHRVTSPLIASPRPPSSSAPELPRHAQLRVKTHAAAGADAGSAPAPTTAGNSTFTQAVFNVVNVMMGVGLLSLPFALKSSGWVGLLVLWVMGIATNYTAKVLCECAEAVTARNPGGGAVSYEDIAEAAFGPIGRVIISAIIYVELFGTCALLFILEGDNMFKLFGSTGLASSPAMYMLVAALVMIPTVWLPDLKSLSFLGAAGVTATCTVSAAVAYTFLSGSYVPGAPTDLAIWSTLPLVLGICTFCYSGHGVFPAIQKSMKNPKEFPQVLNVAYLVVAALCTLMGAAGYHMYGTGALDLITFNLSGITAVACAVVILVNPPAKFALTMEPVAAALQGAVPGARKGLMRVATRTALAIAILCAARSLPFLAHVMALVGSFMTISVSVTFPPLCHQ